MRKRCDFEKAAAFIPKRLDSTMSATDVAFAIDTTLGLGRLDEARKLIRNFERFGQNMMVDDWTGGVLQSRIAEYFARVGDYERAIHLWEPLRTHRGVAESAILELVELRIALAVRAVNEGFSALRELRANPDPELAVALPGNEDAGWNRTEKKLEGVARKLRRALSKEFRKQHSLD